MYGKRLEAVTRTARILWVAFLVAAVAYLPLGLVVRSAAAPPSAPEPLVAIALAAAAFIDAVLSFVLPAQIFRNAVRARGLAVAEEIDPAAMPGAYRDQAAKRRVLKEPAKVELAAAAVGLTTFIMEGAMREAVVLFGFVLLFLGHAPVIWGPFFAVGWILLALAWPSPRAWLRRVERVYDARLATSAEPSGGGQRPSDATNEAAGASAGR